MKKKHAARNKSVTANFTASTMPNVAALTSWVSGTTNTKVAEATA